MQQMEPVVFKDHRRARFPRGGWPRAGKAP